MFQKPHPCTECDFRAAQKATLTNHLKHHGAEMAYKCKKCSFAHSAKKLVATHEVEHHTSGQVRDDDVVITKIVESASKRGASQMDSQTSKRQKLSPAKPEPETQYELTPKDVEDGFILASGWKYEGLKCPTQLAKDPNRPILVYPYEDNMIPPLLHTLQKPRDFNVPIAVIKDPASGKVLCEMFYQCITIGRTRSIPNYEVDVNLEDDTVSKRHGMIKYIFERSASGQLSAYFVYVSFGKNGSFVAGTFVGRGRRYLPGDALIQCGTSPIKLKFEIKQQNIQAAHDVLRARIEGEEKRKEAELKAQQDW